MKTEQQPLSNTSTSSFPQLLEEYILSLKLVVHLLGWHEGKSEFEEDDDKRFSSLKQVIDILYKMESRYFSVYYKDGLKELYALKTQYNLSEVLKKIEYELTHGHKIPAIPATEMKIFSLENKRLRLEKGNFDNLFKILQEISKAKKWVICVPWLIEDIIKVLNENQPALSDVLDKVEEIFLQILKLPVWLENQYFTQQMVILLGIIENFLQPLQFENFCERIINAVPDENFNQFYGLVYVYAIQHSRRPFQIEFFLSKKNKFSQTVNRSVLGAHVEKILPFHKLVAPYIGKMKKFLTYFKQQMETKKINPSPVVLHNAANLALNFLFAQIGLHYPTNDKFFKNPNVSIQAYLTLDRRQNIIRVHPYQLTEAHSVEFFMDILKYFIRQGADTIISGEILMEMLQGKYYAMIYELLSSGAVKITDKTFPWQTLSEAVTKAVWLKSSEDLPHSFNFQEEAAFKGERYFLHQLWVMCLQIPWCNSISQKIETVGYLCTPEEESDKIQSLNDQYWTLIQIISAGKTFVYNKPNVRKKNSPYKSLEVFFNTRFGHFGLTPLMLMVLYSINNPNLASPLRRLVQDKDFKIDFNLKNLYSQTLADMALATGQYEIADIIIKTAGKSALPFSASKNLTAPLNDFDETELRIHIFLQKLIQIYNKKTFFTFLVASGFNIGETLHTLNLFSKLAYDGSDPYLDIKVKHFLYTLLGNDEIKIFYTPEEKPEEHLIPALAEVKSLKIDPETGLKLSLAILTLVNKFIAKTLEIYPGKHHRWSNLFNKLESKTSGKSIQNRIEENRQFLEKEVRPRLVKLEKTHQFNNDGTIICHSCCTQSKAEAQAMVFFQELNNHYKQLYDLINQNLNIIFSSDQKSLEKLFLLERESVSFQKMLDSLNLPNMKDLDNDFSTARLSDFKKHLVSLIDISRGKFAITPTQQIRFNRFRHGLSESSLFKKIVSLHRVWKEITESVLRLPTLLIDPKLSLSYKELDSRLNKILAESDEKLKILDLIKNYHQLTDSCETSLKFLQRSLEDLKLLFKQYPVMNNRNITSRDINSCKKQLSGLPSNKYFGEFILQLDNNLQNFKGRLLFLKEMNDSLSKNLAELTKFDRFLSDYIQEANRNLGALNNKILLIQNYNSLLDAARISESANDEERPVNTDLEPDILVEEKTATVSKTVQISPESKENTLVPVSPKKSTPKVWLALKGKGITFDTDFKTEFSDYSGSCHFNFTPSISRNLHLSDYVDHQMEHARQEKMFADSLKGARVLLTAKINFQDMEEVAALRSSFLYYIACLANYLNQAVNLPQHWSIPLDLYKQMSGWFLQLRNNIFHVLLFADYNDLTNTLEQQRIKHQTIFLRNAMEDICQLLPDIISKNLYSVRNVFELLSQNPLLKILAVLDTPETLMRLDSPLFEIGSKPVLSMNNFERIAVQLQKRITSSRKRLQDKPEEFVCQYALAFYINHFNKLRKTIKNYEHPIPSLLYSNPLTGILAALEKDCNEFRHAFLPGTDSHEMVEVFMSLLNSESVQNPAFSGVHK